MQPLEHLILILLAWCLCLPLPQRFNIFVLTCVGIFSVLIFASAAAIFILICAAEATVMVLYFRNLNRNSNWRKYGPYLLFLNLLFVDLHQWILLMPIATMAISFSIVRIFMTAKQLLGSRKKLPPEDMCWILVAAFYLPAVVIGPVFSGTDLRDQHRSVVKEKVVLRDYRMVLQGLVLAVLVSPGFGQISTSLEQKGFDAVGADWPFLFLQLFAAFWGQSLISEHTSRFFGYRLPVNFDHPWKARTIKEFWARWHRSMAQFVLQYIFLPLTLRGISPKLATVAAFVFMGVWHNLTIGYF